MRRMSWMTWRIFGLPQGLLGRLGGRILAVEGKEAMVRHVLSELHVAPGEAVLEVGFGPGVGIRLAAERVGKAGFVAGVDPSDVMLDAATNLNSTGIDRGIVELKLAGADHLPFPDERFDKAFAMYTLQLWHDTTAGLREMHRTLKPGAQLLLAGRKRKGIDRVIVLRQIRAAGFGELGVQEYRGTLLFRASKRVRAFSNPE
ncbi:MAG TPA: methyltransferase domain-containing protein [Rhodanobacteraceae bacterium]|nr:methyltransferase domain-containing protein [Rhodanobacteraceae bacterium]